MNANSLRYLQSETPRSAALATGLLAIALAASPVASAQQPADTGDDDAQTETGERPTSTEQGQTPLDESFAKRTHAEWVRETRRKAWEDTKWDIQVRSYYLDRDKFDDTESLAWALGGSVGLKTGYFRERFAFGATAYASVPLHAPDDKDGTLLLKPGQEGYGVLGQLYGEYLLSDEVRITAGRLAIDTSYINRNDVRMTPNTFEAATIQGLHGGDDRPEWRWGAGYFDEIKERNSDEFVSMSIDAGAPVERGVFAGGLNYKVGDFSIGAIDYYSNDIINIFYTEAKHSLPLGKDLRLNLSLQYSDQRSVGDDLLRGEDFSADQWGVKTELSWKGALFSAAYTSAGGDTNMQNPWSGYPGYTSVQVEDFNRDGEDAWLLRAAYNFESVKGMSVYALYVDGSTPDDPAQFAKDEYDLNWQWTVPEGTFKGLMMRVRYAQVSQADPASSDLEDLRVMVYYDPPAF
jgi:hypothetical protein